MAHSSDWAKRLLNRLPKQKPAALLERIKTYADATFLDQYFFPWLDEQIFSDPRVALPWAEVAPDLALVAPEAKGPDGRQEHRDRLVKAWALAGGAHRACGQYSEAETAFAKGLGIADSEAVSPLTRADLERRRAYLLACRGESESAFVIAQGAVDLVRGLENPVPLALSLVCRGYVLNNLRRFSEAVRSFGEALALVNPKGSSFAARLHLTAIANMAYAVSASPHHRDHSAALSYVKQAGELVKGGRRFLPRYRLLWIEGLILGHLGYHGRRAEKAFMMALEGFEALELPYEIALTCLDLGQLYAIHSEWSKLEPLAQNAFERFRLLSADKEAIVALSQYLDAVKARQLTEEMSNNARQIIERNIGPGGCCKTRKKGPA